MSEHLYGVYEHHGKLVGVRQDLQGKHWDHCLCKECARFQPDTENNCPIAEDTRTNCKKHNLVTPVWECPSFTLGG